MFLLTSCHNDGIVYDHSADVSTEQWTPADTCGFDIRVCETAIPGSLVTSRTDYTLDLSVRYVRTYPCNSLPLHLMVDGQREYVVTLPLADSLGLPDGDCWAESYTKQFVIRDLTIQFPDTGLWKFNVWPDTTCVGIRSLTVTLR